MIRIGTLRHGKKNRREARTRYVEMSPFGDVIRLVRKPRFDFFAPRKPMPNVVLSIADEPRRRVPSLRFDPNFGIGLDMSDFGAPRPWWKFWSRA